MSRARVSRFALFLSITLFAPVAASAQTRPATRPAPAQITMEPWSFGVTAGVTISNLKADNNADLDMAWGGTAGVFAGTNFNRNVGLQVEALVSQRGAKNDAGGDRTLRLTYLDVPVVIRLGNTETNDTHFHAFTGLTPGFKLASDLTNSATTLTIGVNDDIKTFDLGWVIGAAVERGPWSFDARYTLGLVDINDVAGGADLKNRSAGFKVSYRIR